MSKRNDGRPRPYVVRQRRQRYIKRVIEYENDPANAEWLAQFKMGERRRFLMNVVPSSVIWLRAFMTETDLGEQESALLLEQLGFEKHWMKLRKTDGMVVGIGKPRTSRKPKKDKDRLDDPIVSRADPHAERMLDGGDATFSRTDDGYEDPREAA